MRRCPPQPDLTALLIIGGPGERHSLDTAISAVELAIFLALSFLVYCFPTWNGTTQVLLFCLFIFLFVCFKCLFCLFVLLLFVIGFVTIQPIISGIRPQQKGIYPAIEAVCDTLLEIVIFDDVKEFLQSNTTNICGVYTAGGRNIWNKEANELWGASDLKDKPQTSRLKMV